MGIEKLIETAKVCCGDIKSEDCSEQCIDPRDNRGTGEDRFCRQWLIHDLYTALSTLKDENEKLRAELEQVIVERDAAISDLETIMAYGGGNLDTCQYCKNGQCYARGGTKLCLPKWRGIKED